MIDDLVAAAPKSLAAATGMVTVAPAERDSRTLAHIAAGTLVADLGACFGGTFAGADRRALASLWSMYYLGGLIIPATVALLRLDRVLPVDLDTIAFDLDADGRVARFRLPHAGDAGLPGRRFDTLVRGHLAPLIALLSSQTALSPRVLWSNAAVIMDHAVGELIAAGDLRLDALDEARTLLGGTGSPCFGITKPFSTSRDGATRERTVCCLRYRLPGIGACAGICPIERRRAPAPCFVHAAAPEAGRRAIAAVQGPRDAPAV